MKKNQKAVLIVGNWKMNPGTLEEAKKRFISIKKSAAAHSSLSVVVCPPFPFVASLAGLVNGGKVGVGGQDVSVFEEGTAHTGDVSAKMVASAGAKYIILGHSERRAMGDTGITIAEKIKQALKTEMNLIICIGEKERDADGGYLEVIKIQLKEVLAGINKAHFGRIILAYEPVWAVGNKNNEAASSHDLHQMVVYIRKCLREMFGDAVSSAIPILYGGSVTPENAEDIIWNGEVNGLLVGRASWQADTFGALFKAINGGPKAHSTKALKETLRKAKNNKHQRYNRRDQEKISLKQFAKLEAKKSAKKPVRKSSKKKAKKFAKKVKSAAKKVFRKVKKSIKFRKNATNNKKHKKVKRSKHRRPKR